MEATPRLSSQLEPDAKLLIEMLRRQSLLSLVFGVAFGLYGFMSLSVIQTFQPDLTLWGNVWPRLLLNTVPYLIL